jgi:hypothetical protein
MPARAVSFASSSNCTIINLLVSPLPLVVPTPSIFPLLSSAQFSQFTITFCCPFLLIFLRPLQLCLRFLHKSEWVIGSDTCFLPLIASRIFIAPHVFALVTRIPNEVVALLSLLRWVLLRSIPWFTQAVATRGIGETHCVLILEGLFSLSLLFFSFGILLAFDRFLHVHREQVDVPSMISKRGIACCIP